MILASLFFSFMGALIKYASAGIPVMESVFFRSLVSILLIAPLMLARQVSFFGNNTPMLFLRSLAGFIALSLTVYATAHLTLADASILNQTSVLFVAMLSTFFLKEKVSTPLIVYIICAMVGAVLIVKISPDVLNIPGLVGLTSGFFAAVAYISIRELHKTDSFYTMVFGFSLVSTIGSLPFFPHFIQPNLFQWGALIGLGVTGTIAQLLMTYAYKQAPASIVSPYTFATVLFSALWGGLFWGEIPDIWSFLGALLIISSGIGIIKLKTIVLKTS